MIIVYQIAIGDIPKEIKTCMESVKDFAKQNGYSYETITGLSDKSKGESNIRNLCDFEKVKILSENKYSLIIDWDVLIDKSFDFSFNDEIKINPQGDFFLYNGKDTETFLILKESMNEHFVSENEIGMLFKAWNRCIATKKINISKDNIVLNGYKHLYWNKVLEKTLTK